jgi:hypothetical protein
MDVRSVTTTTCLGLPTILLEFHVYNALVYLQSRVFPSVPIDTLTTHLDLVALTLFRDETEVFRGQGENIVKLHLYSSPRMHTGDP